MSPYVGIGTNPLIFVDPDGRDIIICFGGRGSAISEGGYSAKTLPINSNSVPSQIVKEAVNTAQSSGIECNGIAIKPSERLGQDIQIAMDFLIANFDKPHEKIVIYGYSKGGDVALEFARQLQEKGFEVDLLITVDAADPVDHTLDYIVPSNVKVSYNIYQEKPSKGPFGLPGRNSRGYRHSSENCELTSLYNANASESNRTNNLVTHKSLQKLTKNWAMQVINFHISKEVVIKAEKERNLSEDLGRTYQEPKVDGEQCHGQ